MNDETLKEILRRVGDFYRNMKRGKDCPPDDILVDFVYGDLSAKESRDVLEHIKSCERCRFEVLKLETDRDIRQEALDKDPDAALAQALGKEGLDRIRREFPEWEGSIDSVRHPKETFPGPNEDVIDRIAREAAAEVLDNVDLHLAYWKETRARPQYGRDSGLASATGLGENILPFIADAIGPAWEWCVANRSDLVPGVLNPDLADRVSSSFRKSKELSGISDKEIDVLVEKIALLVIDAVTRAAESVDDA